MPRISFTPNLERHIHAPRVETTGHTVREALDAVFVDNPMLRSYLLDEQGRLRQHVAIFVNGEMIQDRQSLSEPIQDSDELFVMQALSGG